jgi:DNA-binding transcriptional regulator WhiA
MEINNEVAELCGVILGDGHLHNTENRITITGSIEDLDYYQNHIIPLFEKYFNIIPKLIKDKNKNSYRLVLQNKRVFNFFINEVGLIRGRKISIYIPRLIFEDITLLKPFIKGLFDTDGSLKFSKQKKEINYYPRIRFSLYRTPLSLELSYVFQKLDFNFGFCVDKRNGVLCYDISGSKNLDKWMNVVGSSNNVHITKYLIWKKFGYVPPKISLDQRQKLLKKKIL